MTAPARFAGARRVVGGLMSAYGMLGVLLLLCAYFAVATYHEEAATGPAAAEQLAASAARAAGSGNLVVVGQDSEEDRAFGQALAARLAAAKVPVAATVYGDPPAVRAALANQPGGVALVATTPACRDWRVWESLRGASPANAALKVMAPEPVRIATFLAPNNLRNVADQIAVIAILAVGMTMVIITAGIDLSVGSLIALSAVAAAWLIRRWGGDAAGPGVMLAASLAAILLAGAVGGFSGFVITVFRIPPFIATLAMMQVASGLAFILAQGQSIYAIPTAYTWLGRGAGLFLLPNSVVLMALIYLGAHLFMTQTAAGRRIYAVGGNLEAARLSGINTRRTLRFVYTVSGLMAGLGGVITTSQLKTGAPTYGNSYELYVIAAVVVGGTSLSGGEGRIFGTLIGAFIIAVIRNGMNLLGVESYQQKVVLGLVILGAVLLDRRRREERG